MVRKFAHELSIKSFTRRSLLTLAGVCVGVPCLAAATDTSADQGDKLEEIVVTAQKRTENLQQVPISAQVIGSQALAEQNQTSLENLTQTVPAVHVSAGQSANAIFIRGIGSAENPSFDQSVATFVDDIYFGRSRLSQVTFLDLDRIEILKGPQSTFFGNNAIAGALNIVTKKPGDTFDASARALYGMFGQYAVEGAVGGPITDMFGARLAITRDGDDRGWIENVNTDQHVPVINNLAGRLTLVFKPFGNLEATLKTEASRHRTSGTDLDGGPYQWTNCPLPAPFTTTFGGSFGGCAPALAAGVPIGLNKNEISQIPGQYNSLSMFEEALTVNYHQWGQTFSSTSGFYNYHYNQNNEQGGLPTPVVTNQLPEKYHQFSQEFRVASDNDLPVQYMVGGYFQTDKLVDFGEINLPFLNSIIEAIPPFAPLVPYLPLAEASGFSQVEHVYSAFGSLNWRATDRLSLQAGLRASWVNKDSSGPVLLGTGTQTYGGFVPLPPSALPFAEALLFPSGAGVNLSRSDKAVMPSAGLQYQLNPQAMVYFTYSKGFKAGGINGQLGTFNAPTTLQYAPEHVNAYELGLKSKWLDDTVLVNFDVFRSNYKDLQVSAEVYSPSTGFYVGEVTNAAVSVSQGVELETQWAVNRDLRLSANVTYLDAYYASFPNAPPATLQTFCGQSAANDANPQCSVFPQPVPQIANLAGQPPNYAPRWSGSLNASYSIPLPGQYKLTTEVSSYFTSHYYIGSGSDPFFIVGSYVRLDSRLTLQSPGDHWSVDLIGKNLTDRDIVTSYYSLIVAAKEQPRNVAIQLRYHF